MIRGRRGHDRMVVGFTTTNVHVPMQSVPITTKVVSLFESCSWRGVLDTALHVCDKVCQ